VIDLNLVASFNAARLQAECMAPTTRMRTENAG
jgi:hypothetical protein